MIKSISLIRRKPELTREEFIRHYEEVHAPLALSCLPSLQRYVRNYVTADTLGTPADFDVMCEFWYSNEDGLKEALLFYRSEAGQVLRDDERKFMDADSIRAYRVIEHGGEAAEVGSIVD